MIKHVTVFAKDGVYAGWPANHGAWQWGDEFLVGFMVGEHTKRGMHNIKEPFTKMLARSSNGGQVWHSFVPNVDFEAGEPDGLPSADPDCPRKDLIYRFCGRYDHGGEYCRREGGYYASPNRGKTWYGPYSITEKIPNKFHCTTRTCVLDDTVFLSYAVEEHWGSDWVVCGKIGSDGWFKHKGIVLNDEFRAVMPTAVKVLHGTPVGDIDRVVVCMRRRGPPRKGGWIDSVYSDDNCATWSKPVHVADTGVHNGNPPALIEHNDLLYCAYANRSYNTINLMVSRNHGESWCEQLVLRRGKCSDIGYPRLFKRKDGKLVCVYYWSEDGEAQHIEATIFDV